MHADDAHGPEMTSVVEQQHQHQSQQYVGGGGGGASEKLCCKDCGMNFDSRGSLETHLRYHQDNLMNQWVNSSSQTEESNNNNSKAGNHNSGGVQPGHVSAGPPKRDSVTAPADSSESSSSAVSEGPRMQQQQQQHQEQQQQQQQSQQQQQHHQQGFNQFSAPMFNEPQFFMHNEATAYMMQQQQQQHHYSPDRSEEATGGPSPRSQVAGYARYHPYGQPQQQQQQQHYDRANSVSSSSPRSTVQCEQCGAVCEDASQLAEHVRSSHHPGSPGAGGAYPAQQPPPAQAQPPPQPPPQYQQLAGSPQQQSQQQVAQSQQSQAQTQQQQMLASPPQSQPGQHQHQQQQQQQSSFEFVSVGVVKSEKQEPEEQTEILDLDSLKVQTHRFEEENFMRMQQHQQEMHMMQQQVMQQHQARGPAHSVSSLLWPPAAPQSHEYHPGLSPMGPMDSVSPIQEQQNQFMRGQPQHMSQVEPPRHPGSPIISSTQPMPGLPMSAGLLQQNPKPPPLSGSQPWKSNEARRPKTYNCTACNKWFTSSGHLKRHYNTTLHKNAVKQSNQPDPANMPISAHHHPGRDANPGRGAAASRNSPELSSSSSPPNLMAGPSGEATRGLLHTPTTTTALFSSSNNSNSSSNSNEATPAQPQLAQPAPPLPPQLQPPPGLGQGGLPPGLAQAQQQPSAILASSLMYLGSPVSSPMGQQHPQHLQPMNSPSPQLAQAAHHLPMGSPSQLGASGHHLMSSPISPMQQQQHQQQQQQQPPPQQHPASMNSPSPMGSGQPAAHLHMHSPTGIMAGSLPAMGSPPGSMMGGTSMPQQPYPNALPPHVTTITSIPVLLESITTQLTTTGDRELTASQSQEMLPGFGTFSAHSDGHSSGHGQPTKMMPNFTQFGSLVGGGYLLEHSPQAVNVGGLASEHEGYDPVGSSYDMYPGESPQPLHYEYGMVHSAELGSYPQPQQQPVSSQQAQYEANNNLPVFTSAIKEEIDPNINPKKRAAQAKAQKRRQAKEEASKDNQVSSSKPSSHYISENGTHKCIECDKVFNKACYLTQHNKSFHSGDKPFKCNQCGKRFPQEVLHAEHLQKHAGDKPYKCEICPKQFNHKTDLRRHLCLHTGEKPYACDNCGKGFIRKDHMMKHLETHKKKSNQHKVHLRA